MCVTSVWQSRCVMASVFLHMHAWFMRATNRPEMEVRHLYNDPESVSHISRKLKGSIFLTFAQLLLRLGRYLLVFAATQSLASFSSSLYRNPLVTFNAATNCTSTLQLIRIVYTNLQEFTRINYTRWRTSLYIKYSWTRARRDFRIRIFVLRFAPSSYRNERVSRKFLYKPPRVCIFESSWSVINSLPLCLLLGDCRKINCYRIGDVLFFSLPFFTRRAHVYSL